MANRYDLEERLLDFAVRIGKVVDALPDMRMGRHIAGQLVRCGTSPAPNYSEACAGESRRDFTHKLGICLKELRECRCWLWMICKCDMLPGQRLEDLLDGMWSVVQHHRKVDRHGEEKCLPSRAVVD